MRHATPNIVLALCNVLVGILFTGLAVAAAEWARVNTFGLLNVIEPRMPLSHLIGFLLFDAWMYIWHRASHRIFILWRMHRTHHTDPAMDATTALRFHPLEITVSHGLNCAVIMALGLSYQQVIIYNIALLPIIIFHHSNIALPEKWDRLLRVFIVAPNMHRVHHSRIATETNSNYGSVFSFWDRLFGTFRHRNDPGAIVYGAPTFMEPRWQSVAGILLVPFH